MEEEVGNRDEQLTESSLLAFYLKLRNNTYAQRFTINHVPDSTNINFFQKIFLKTRASLVK